jgi:CBS domain containing-hemolysin-like protein
MIFSVAITITIVAIILSGFFSGAEIAFVQSNKIKIEIDATKKGVVNRIIQIFTRHTDNFLSTLLVGNNIVLVIYGIAISVILNPVLEAIFANNEMFVLIANTVISTAIILITGEFFPKTIFRINPNFMIRIFALPLYVIYILLYPITMLVSGISQLFMKIFGIKHEENQHGILTMQQLDDYIQQSMETVEEKDTVENEVKIFRNAIDFKDTQIGECMTPRNEIIAVNLNSTTKAELTERFINTGLSKIVVYKDDIDNVVGYIHVSELFVSGNDWKKHIKPVIFTPETMLANKMMQRLLAEKRSMTIVIDEFGGTAGLVTLEDLVEEIFGEIEDEHDHQKLIARQLPNGDYEFSGRVEIERLNEEYNLDFRESDKYNTLGGYLLNNLEALPAVGDTFTIDDIEFKIMRMSAARIELVKVHKNL